MTKHSVLDTIEVITSSEKYKGIVMPSKDKKYIFLKLNSGYNIGIKKTKIKKVKIIKKYKKEKTITRKLKIHKNLPTIALLHTGGTFASKVDYITGGVIARFTPEEIVAMFPELEKIANIKSEFISNMLSEDMCFKDYIKIVKEIEKQYKKGVKGIIITHGTDTLHYTSAALSFMLKKCPIPVILVGAQRSSDRGSSDAAMNLTCAALFIAKTDYTGVAICMHETINDTFSIILPGTKARKLHSSRRDAFKVVNDTPIAKINYMTKQITLFKPIISIKNGLEIKPKMEEKVAILKVHPNMSEKQFLFYKNYKGLIIEGTGLGHAPVGTKEHIKILNAIKKLVKAGCIVAISTQTIFGKVNLNVYSNGIKLLEAGVVPCEDMTTETAFIKLSWLLANYPKDKIKDLMVTNLKGEINERLQPSGI